MNIIYSIIIQPIEEIIEFVFCFVNYKFYAFGTAGAIVAVSLAVNFLALPLYNMADALQLKERQLQLKMAPWIKHIKATFKGDEQFMMLNTWYRQNGYHPLYALRSALSILIEIPFFIAAYHFLSNCSLLDGESIFFLHDLGSPDALFKIGSFSVNVLPILMTGINIVSSAIYTKGAPLREKLQVYVLALVFLVLLYNSPSGLVFYWILNNTFSLAKNIVLKMKHPGSVVYACFAAMLVTANLYLAFKIHNVIYYKKLVVYIGSAVVLAAPLIVRKISVISSKHNVISSEFERSFSKKDVSTTVDMTRGSTVDMTGTGTFSLLFFSCLSLCLLCGLLLPANVISTATAEFSFMGETENPLSYVWTSLSFFTGLFLFWPLAVYKLFGKKVKAYMPPIMFIFAAICLGNAFIFRHKYGLISTLFTLDNVINIKKNTPFLIFGPVLFLILITFLVYILYRFKKEKYLSLVMIILCVAELSFGILRTASIKKDFAKIKENRSSELTESTNQTRFTLSRNQKNVIIFFLDRAISSYFPYIMDQFPELKDIFSGFTWYPNCLSFSAQTNSAFPPLAGGYEYTPLEMNARKSELLRVKHNEATLVMPKLFSDAGWSTTLYELPYINYDQGYSKEYDFTEVKKLSQSNVMRYKLEHQEDVGLSNPDVYTRKTCRYFSIMQLLYPPVRNILTDGTEYYYDRPKNVLPPLFLEAFADLYYMDQYFSYDSKVPTFNFICNNTTHEYTVLRDDYLPAVLDGETNIAAPGCEADSETPVEAWHANVAAYIQLSKTLDMLKQEGIWDNTRIIIVADHGRDIPLKAFDAFSTELPNSFNPLFLVKDFGETGPYKTDNTFITNADTLVYATKNLGLSENNPYTGKKLKSHKDFDSFKVHEMNVWRIDPLLNSTQFPMENTSTWTVTDNIFLPENWREE